MSSARERTALILGSVAVCLLVYVMKKELQGPRRHSRAAEIVGAIKGALGSRRATDCSKISPGHADWARCAQGSAIGRVPTKNAAAVVKNTSLDFASDSLRNQGLGTGRLQDDFVHDQYSGALGAPRTGGMRIDKSGLKNNGYFSRGTQNASSLLTASAISADGAAAFPFSSKSGEKREEYAKTSGSGNVPGTEPVGMGMKWSALKRKFRAASSVDGRGSGRRSASRAQVNKKLGVAPFEEEGAEFNPFAGESSSTLGQGLKITEAFDARKLGMGSGLEEAYGGSLGAAVSPFSASEASVSPDEIAAATAALESVNIVQSTGGGNIDRFIRP